MYECKIAEKLVKLRTSKGITQDDVAKSLSVSNKTISNTLAGMCYIKQNCNKKLDKEVRYVI